VTDRFLGYLTTLSSHKMGWTRDHEQGVAIDLEGDGGNLFHDTILAFIWRY
jgi:hypothetical protein